MEQIKLVAGYNWPFDAHSSKASCARPG